MMHKSTPATDRSTRKGGGFPHRLVALAWGLPTGIAFTIIFQGRRAGFRRESYLGLDFVVSLVVALIVYGYGGMFFSRKLHEALKKLGVTKGEE